MTEVERIKTGDKVTMHFCGDEYFSISGCNVIHTPQGTGDLWQVALPGGTVWAMNPYASDFLCFERAPVSNPSDGGTP